MIVFILVGFFNCKSEFLVNNWEIIEVCVRIIRGNKLLGLRSNGY